MQWTPDYIQWLYNDRLVRKVENTSIIDQIEREQHLMMNFWIPAFEKWHDGFSPVEMPWYARYDFVEVWDYVPPSEWETTDSASE